MPAKARTPLQTVPIDAGNASAKIIDGPFEGVRPKPHSH